MSEMTLRLRRGESARYRLTVTDEDGDRLDLSGAQLYFRAKKTPAGSDPVLIAKSSAVSAEIEILDQDPNGETVGQADVRLVPADTRALAPGTLKFEARVVLADGETRTVAFGSLHLDPEVVNLAAPDPPPSGSPAAQTESERSFAHQLDETASSFTVAIPGGMVSATYSIAYAFGSVPEGGPVGILSFSDQTPSGFTVTVVGGYLLVGTVIDFIVRHRA